MQNRYTGDIGDFGKFGLLRQLSHTGLSIGVNWYLTPDETHNGDGRHIEYLKKDSFRSCDEYLWQELGHIVTSGKRGISALESPTLLQAKYYSRLLDFSGTVKSNLANVCQGLFLKTTTQKWRTKLTHQIAGFEKMIYELNVIDTTTHSIKDTVSAVKEKIVSGTALLF